jgi:8-oxo-dGTP diphosphatase
MDPNASAPHPQVAVGAVCVRQGRLLLVQRGRAPGRGRWSLPGGRLEPGETLETSVARELQEETGLSARVGALCGVAERQGPGFHYVICNFWVEATGAATAADDATGVVWAARHDLRGLDLVPRLEEFLEAHGVVALLA